MVDTGLRKGDCSSQPLHSLTRANFSFRDPYRLSYETSYVNFIDCEAPINSSLYNDMAASSTKSNSSNSYLSSVQNIFICGSPRHVPVRFRGLLQRRRGGWRFGLWKED